MICVLFIFFFFCLFICVILHSPSNTQGDQDEHFWCHSLSYLVHPVGWSSVIGHHIDASPGYWRLLLLFSLLLSPLLLFFLFLLFNIRLYSSKRNFESKNFNFQSIQFHHKAQQFCIVYNWYKYKF